MRANVHVEINRLFLSSLVPLFQNESKYKTFHMKMSSAYSFIFMQIKVIFIRMVSHLDSLWNRGTRELGKGLLDKKILQSTMEHKDVQVFYCSSSSLISLYPVEKSKIAFLSNLKFLILYTL